MPRRAAAAAAGRDRLSALPDDLLHRILRPLDARQAVRDLSLLSRRWRRVWASSPCVTLQHSAGSERFGNNLLLLRDPMDLRVLCLHSSGSSFQHRWLRHALSRGLRVLELTITCGYSFQLPGCVFTCATLEEISLSSAGIIIISPKSVFLPRLKKLHLESVQITDPSAVEELSSGCPALEDLNLSWCLLRSFKISSETLKTLSITDCAYAAIHVSAPNTASLKLTVSRRVHLSSMPSLLSAWVYISDDAAADQLSACAHDLVSALCNAQHLELFRFDLLLQDAVQKSATEGLSFNNLKSIYIGEWLVTDFYNTLDFFIQCAPNLIALTLDQWKLYQENDGNLSCHVSRGRKPNTDGKLKLQPALTRNLERLLIRLSKGDDIEEFRKMRSSLKEKTKPRELEVVWF